MQWTNTLRQHKIIANFQLGVSRQFVAKFRIFKQAECFFNKILQVSRVVK